MRIIDPVMAKKMDRVLKLGQNLYNLDDIDDALATGFMQAHTVGNTLAITTVNDWPRRKSVDIVYLVGDLDEALILDKQISEWAKNLGADLVTFTGRDGWWKFNHTGWKKIGTKYAKEI
jgi:hypothetical protein